MPNHSKMTNITTTRRGMVSRWPLVALSAFFAVACAQQFEVPEAEVMVYYPKGFTVSIPGEYQPSRFKAVFLYIVFGKTAMRMLPDSVQA